MSKANDSKAKDNKVKKLKYWLSPKQTIFADFDTFVLDNGDSNKHRIFIDRSSTVLFVAHIDTVQKPKFIRNRKTKSGELKRVYAWGLDDRLGCMIAFQLSEELNADLLICDNEEKCRSTGQFHELKDYNWIAEFDREGKDVVTYDLDCDEFRTAISEYLEIGFGTFSDISQLQTTACCMNVGIGIKFSHSKDSYVCIETMNQQIVKFKRFYEQNKNTKFVQDYKTARLYDYDYDGECEICGLNTDVDYIYGHIICQDCFEAIFSQYFRYV